MKDFVQSICTKSEIEIPMASANQLWPFCLLQVVEITSIHFVIS